MKKLVYLFLAIVLMVTLLLHVDRQRKISRQITGKLLRERNGKE